MLCCGGANAACAVTVLSGGAALALLLHQIVQLVCCRRTRPLRRVYDVLPLRQESVDGSVGLGERSNRACDTTALTTSGVTHGQRTFLMRFSRFFGLPDMATVMPIGIAM